jgi:heme exporter protein A
MPADQGSRARFAPSKHESSKQKTGPLVRLTGSGLAAVRGGRPVFGDLFFSVAEGELLAVTGPNGAGKSTLLRLIAGLLRPAVGTLLLEPAGEDGIGRLAHYLGHLDALKPSLSLADNLAYWQRLFGAQQMRIDEALDAVGLSGLGGLPVSTLSAGQKRRAAIARLVLSHRPIWLLDEPLTGLDAHAEIMLGRLIDRHRGEGGLAIVATHRDLPAMPTATLMLGGAR